MTKIYFHYNEQRETLSFQNNADAYFTEFFNLLGVKAEKISLSDSLPKEGVLFLGEGDYNEKNEALRSFIGDGGTVVALNSRGIDELSGIEKVGMIRADGDFSLNGHFLVSDTVFLSEKVSGYALPVLSDIRNCRIKGEETVARGIVKEHGTPVFFERKYGKGKIFTFTFSLLKTLWYKTQGRPVYEDIDGDGYMRSGDSIIPDASDDYLIPAVDIYLHLIENMIWSVGEYPMFHQIPPTEGRVNDYAIHFAGDEDWCGEELFTANKDMRERGITYHAHFQPVECKKFTLDKKRFDDLKAEGLEPSLHFDFITNNALRYGKEDLKRQAELYKETFGEMPVVANTHWFLYNGFGETGRWFSELGLTGTIRQIGIKTDLFDINAMNLYGFAFGTSYPTHILDDAEHGNKAYDVSELKIVFYEPRLRTEEDKSRIKKEMELSDDFALINNIFIHPTYFTSDREAVIAAVDEILSYTKDKNVAFMSTNEVAKWWKARAHSELVKVGGNTYSINAKAPVILKFSGKVRIKADGKQMPVVAKTIAGRRVYLTALPAGNYEITIAE